MKALTLALGLAILSLNAMADVKYVQCSVERTPKYWAIFKLNGDKIVLFSRRAFAGTDLLKDSPFYLLGNRKDTAIESYKSFIAKNGYSIATYTTTADSITIGISRDMKRGFYKYQDLGSGNGPSEHDLACKVVAR